MELLRLDLFAPLGSPIGADPVRKEAPPIAVDTGPPLGGAPPPGLAGPQKEVAAIELKPQAKILDLLERILLADSNPPHDAFVQKGGLTAGTGDRELAAKVGALKLDVKAPDFSDILVALGVPVPARFDASNVEHFKKAIADAFVSKTLPSVVADVVAFTREIFGARPVDATPEAPTNDFEAVGYCIEGEAENGERAKARDVIVGPRPRFVPVPLFAPLTPDPTGTKPVPDAVPNQTGDFVQPQGDVAPTVGLVTTQPGDQRPDTRMRTRPDGSRPIVVTGARHAYSGQGLEKEVVEALGLTEVKVEGDRPSVFVARPVFRSDRWSSLMQKAPTTQMVVAPPALLETPAIESGPVGKPVIFHRSVPPKDSSFSNVERPLTPVGKPVVTGAKPKPNADVLAGTVPQETDRKDGLQDVTVKATDVEKAAKSKPRDLEPDADTLDVKAREPLTKGEAIAATKEADVARAVKPVRPEASLDAKATDAVKAKVIEQIEEMSAVRGNGRVTIRLQPDDLGTITLAVRSFGESIEVKATASNEGVRYVLHAQRTDLVQSVESRGLSLSSFTVGSEQHTDAQHGHSKQNQDMRQDFARSNNLWNARHDETRAGETPIYGRYKLVGVDTLA